MKIRDFIIEYFPLLFLMFFFTMALACLSLCIYTNHLYKMSALQKGICTELVRYDK